MPNIRVSDEVYDKLKAFADREMRSVANATEYLLSLQLGTASADTSDLFKEATPKPGSQKSEPSARNRGDVMDEIRNLEAERDELLGISQDREYSASITKDYTGRIQDLWDEFHSLPKEL